jgi:hypothetical protein
MRNSFFIILMCCSLTAMAQPSDFLALRKKNKTIKSFYAGTQIEFTTVHGVYKNALINRIQNDTIYVQEWLVRPMMTQLGYIVTDSVGSFRYAYHYKDIKSIGKPQKGFNVQGSGAALLGGGILLTLASGVVYIFDKDKFSPELMAAAAGLAVIGYFLSKSGSKGIVIGKKNYQLDYIKLTP